MEIPDFMSYANKFSQSEFAEKISRIAKRAGAKLVYAALILYYTLQSDKVSKSDKAIIIGALGYMISPLDVIPDAIPIAGLTDDLAVLLFVLKKVWTGIDPEIVEQARKKLSKWFDDEEISEIQNLFDGEEQDLEVKGEKLEVRENLASPITKKAGEYLLQLFFLRGAWRIRTAVDGFADR